MYKVGLGLLTSFFLPPSSSEKSRRKDSLSHAGVALPSMILSRLQGLTKEEKRFFHFSFFLNKRFINPHDCRGYSAIESSQQCVFTPLSTASCGCWLPRRTNHGWLLTLLSRTCTALGTLIGSSSSAWGLLPSVLFILVMRGPPMGLLLIRHTFKIKVPLHVSRCSLSGAVAFGGWSARVVWCAWVFPGYLHLHTPMDQAKRKPKTVEWEKVCVYVCWNGPMDR